MPGAKEGLQARDVTIAHLLRAQADTTAQFGKNHLGDLDEHNRPTAHGFDEFMGSLYHLNAEEEFENEDYFVDPALIKKYQTRGVIHTWAILDGTQRIESTGALGKKRMETIDEEITKALLDLEAKKANKPFFLWWNSTRMHIWTHLKKESQGKTGLGVYPDGMVEHDAMVGQLLDKLKELGLEDNTIVMYSTDNGAESFSWPDGGTTPFRNEKATNWEGGFRVPCAIRWPGVIKPGTVSNDVFAHEDMLPTLLAAAGVPDVKEQPLKGMKIGDKTFEARPRRLQHAPTLWPGKAPDPRKEFFYFNDDGSLVALRYNQWKLVFQEQRALTRLLRPAGTVHAPAPAKALQHSFRIRSSWPTTTASATPSGGSTASSSRARAGVRGQVPGELQGVPAEPEGRTFSLDDVSSSSAGQRKPRTDAGLTDR